MTLRETLGTDVTARYVELITTDKTATRLARQAATGTDYETANLYAVRSGELMAQALADETQTLAYMSYDVAQGTLMPLMTANHEAVTAVTAAIQGNMNAAAGVGLAPVIPALDTSRIDGLAVVAAQADTMEQARQALAEPLVNSSQSVVDRSIRDNAQANSKAGIGATIERKTEAAGTREAPLRVRYKNKVYKYTRKYNVPCNWCANLAGVYEYRNGGRNIPRDVFRRHESCRCTLTYRNGVNRQDVWNHNKVWTVDDAEEQARVVANAQEKTQTQNDHTYLLNHKDAKNYKELTEYARDNLGLEYHGLNRANISILNTFNKEIARVYDKFGNLSENDVLTLISTERKMPRDAAGMYSPRRNAMLFRGTSLQGAEAYASLARSAGYNGGSGWWSTTEPMHVIRHEVGHAVEKLYYRYEPDVQEEIHELFEAVWEKMPEKTWSREASTEVIKKAGEYLSYYGLSSEGEFIAESIASYMSTSPKPIAVEVVNTLLRNGKK